jgi:hypothetical protein
MTSVQNCRSINCRINKGLLILHEMEITHSYRVLRESKTSRFVLLQIKTLDERAGLRQSHELSVVM